MPVKTTGRVRVAHAEKYPPRHEAESCTPVAFGSTAQALCFILIWPYNLSIVEKECVFVRCEAHHLW